MFVPCLFPMNMSCSIYQDSNLCSSVSQSFLTRNVLIMTLRPHRPQSNQIIISHHPKPTIIMYIQCRSQDPSLVPQLLPPGTYIPLLPQLTPLCSPSNCSPPAHSLTYLPPQRPLSVPHVNTSPAVTHDTPSDWSELGHVGRLHSPGGCMLGCLR